MRDETRILPQIRSIEIRPGHIETFKVTIDESSMVVDAEALNDLRLFNRAAIAQLRRSFAPMKPAAWNIEVDRALRAAKEPVQIADEQVRRHGTDSWKDKPNGWLVRGRVPEHGAGLLSGQYSMFKSFVLLDLCSSVMTGLPFLNARTIRRGGVLIFAAEGAGDIPMRTKALIDHKLANQIEQPDLLEPGDINLCRLPLSYLSHCRPLLDPRTVDWMVKIAREEQAYFKNNFGLDLVLIGIDTMSAAAGWENENDAAQVQIVMNHMADVSKATDAFVLAVDHFGKDISAGTRGSIVKESSADTLLAILGERDPETNMVDDTRLVLRKLRSGQQGDVFPFEAKLVDMGHDEYEEPLTSRVIDWDVERPVKEKPAKKKSEAENILDEAFAKAFESSKRITIGGTEVEAIREEHLRAIFKELYQDAKPGSSSDAIGEARRRALKLMKGRIKQGTIDGIEYLWWAPAPF